MASLQDGRGGGGGAQEEVLWQILSPFFSPRHVAGSAHTSPQQQLGHMRENGARQRPSRSSHHFPARLLRWPRTMTPDVPLAGNGSIQV